MKNKKFVIINVLIGILSLLFKDGGILYFNIFGADILLFLSLIITLSVFLSELSSFGIGLLFGIIIDASSSMGHGYNTVVLPLMCLCVSFMGKYLFNNNVHASVTLTFISSFVYSALGFLLFHSGAGLKNTLVYFFKTSFVSALLTAAVGGLLYLAEKRLLNIQNNNKR